MAIKYIDIFNLRPSKILAKLGFLGQKINLLATLSKTFLFTIKSRKINLFFDEFPFS
jgi:hypothetical protein